MARPKLFKSPKPVSIKIEESLHLVALEKIAARGLGSFSEYVSRLIVADQKRKGSVAENTPRHLPQKRGAA